jgi:TetR/AcrR family transcriptional repressor of nem operon
MPRVSREQTEQNRIAIEAAASRLFREEGVKAVSVAQLMAAAGLTHGGFYGHFESKDALAAAACAKAFTQSHDRWTARIRSQANAHAALNGIVSGYLSRKACDHAGDACPAATWARDVAREEDNTPLHQAYLDGVKGLIERLSQLASGDGPAAKREEALVQLALLVGALTLAQASRGDPLSDEILAACRKALAGPASPR